MRSLREFYEGRWDNFCRLAQGGDIDLSHIDPTCVYDKLSGKNPKIVIIGEAPGANEVAQGQPFVGAAGKNLSKLLSLCGIDREGVHITNAVPFRTFKRTSTGEANRTPSTRELKAGAALLSLELSHLSPGAVVLLGGSAKRAAICLDDEKFVLALRNASVNTICDASLFSADIKLAFGFHPSPLVYNQPLKRGALEEFFMRLSTLV